MFLSIKPKKLKKNKYILCSPVMFPQMTGTKVLNDPVTENVSSRHCPKNAKQHIMICIKKWFLSLKLNKLNMFWHILLTRKWKWEDFPFQLWTQWYITYTSLSSSIRCPLSNWNSKCGWVSRSCIGAWSRNFKL